MHKSFLIAGLLACTVAAQDVRELSTPVGHLVYTGVLASTINTAVGNGFRIVDLEHRSNTVLGTTFDAVLVENTGQYAAGWWWYYNQTAAQLSASLAANNARLIDLEPYDDGNGNLRFASVMVDNSGANHKNWWWYYNSSVSSLSSHVSTNNARMVDLEEYVIGSTTYYSGVMIANTGSDARGWWWYTNATASQVGSYLNTNQARLYDLQRRSNGNFNVVMIQDTSPVGWYWWYGLSQSEIVPLIDNFGVRIVDLESYLVGSTRYYTLAAINNSNALTTTVGNLMRNDTDGTVGCWLQQMNGANYANLNGDAVFEPASTMKTLHNTHAMRRVYLGATTLATMLNVFTGTSGSCPQDTGAVSQSLQTVLQLMMRNSDNNRTQAVTAYFGQSNINATAAALGMASTSLNHRLGCGADAIAHPNRITLRDLNTLHERVVNGYLGSYRDTFYDIMLHSVNDLSISSVIDQEAASLGTLTASAIASFKSMTRVAHKGGSYGLSSGGPLWYDRCEFGWLSLPFVSRGTLVDREYGFGAFVNNASVDADARTAIYTHAIPELLRPRIRAALQTWTGALAGAITYGSGCGPGPFALATSSVPRINGSLNYVASNGYASSLAVMAIGFSATHFGALSLPASLVPFGGDAGCQLLCDVAANSVGVANAAGSATFHLSMPNNPGLLGATYYTQCYSFGPALRSTNGIRNIVGF